MVGAVGFRAETSLLSVTQTFEVLFDVFRDYFSNYFFDGKEHADTSSIATLNTDVFFWNLNDDTFLSPIGKDFRCPAFTNAKTASPAAFLA